MSRFASAPLSDDADYMVIRASAARTKGDVVWLACPSTAGDAMLTDVAVSSSASVRRAVVWAQDCASGEVGLVCKRGPCVATVTSGVFTAFHGIETDGGNVEDSGGAADVSCGEAVTDFAVALEGDGASTYTSLKIYLLGEPYTSTT